MKKSIALGLAGLAIVASALAAQDPARRGGQGGKRQIYPCFFMEFCQNIYLISLPITYVDSICF